jgi:hypothetical protein
MSNEQILATEPRVLSDEVAKLTAAVRALVDINQALCKKIEANQTCLEALARAQSNDKAVCSVI